MKENHSGIQKKCGDDVVMGKYTGIHLSNKEVF